MAWRLQANGFGECRKRLLALASAGQDQTPVWRLVGEDVARDADALIDRNTHTRTGNLERSVYERPTKTGVQVGIDGSRAPYAVYLHNGWKFHRRKLKLVQLTRARKDTVLERLRKWLMAPWSGSPGVTP